MSLATIETEVTSRLIDAKLVDWVKVDGSVRSFDKQKAEGLSISIKNDGLLHPIVVRKHPTVEGRFEGVVGKHRWYACHKLLKIDLIEAKVVSATQAQAELMRDAENLFRNPLKPAQFASAMKRWMDAYDSDWKTYQSDQETRKANKAAKSAAPAAEGEVQVGPESESATVADPVEVAETPKPPTNLAKHLSEKTGQSQTSVKRSIAIANAFNDQQLEIFEQMNVPQVWMETIAKIKDQEKRNQVCALIASGRPIEESIAEVTGKTEVKTASGRVTAQEPAAEKELTDEDWVNQSCSEILAILPHKGQFRTQAILYRHTYEARAAFRSKVKGAMDAAKKEGANAGLHGVINRLVNLAHPKHWLQCAKCFGNGVIAGETTPCSKCFGAGFVTTSEKK